MTNHIKKVLRIVEENSEVSTVIQELIKKKQTLVIYATLFHQIKRKKAGKLKSDWKLLLKNRQTIN